LEVVINVKLTGLVDNLLVSLIPCVKSSIVDSALCLDVVCVLNIRDLVYKCRS